MSPPFNAVFGWFLLVGIPLLSLLMMGESRRLAVKMGERYTFVMAVTDNAIFLIMFSLGLRIVAKAGILPLSLAGRSVILLSFVGMIIYSLIVGPREMTMQRWTRWKIGKEREQGSDETKERIQRNLTGLPFVVGGAFLIAAGLFLWMRGATQTSLLAVILTFAIAAAR